MRESIQSSHPPITYTCAAEALDPSFPTPNAISPLPSHITSIQSLNHSKQASFVIPTRLTSNPRCQFRPEPVTIGALHILHVVAIPMHGHKAVDEHEIPRPRPGHGVLQAYRIPHGPVGSAADDVHQCILHVPREFILDHRLERDPVFLLVHLGDGPDLGVISGSKDRADGELLGTVAPFGCAVQLGDILVDVLGDDWGRVFRAVGGQEHEEQAFSLH